MRNLESEISAISNPIDPILTRTSDAVDHYLRVRPLGHSPLVSVVMTTFNSGKYVESALRSLLAQSYWNIEIVVVDDMSDDDTVSIVRKIQTEDDRIRLFRFGANRGTYFSKNYGILMSSGEVVSFMDSDDLSHENRVLLQLDALRISGCIVSTCSYQKLYSDGKHVKQKRHAFISQMMRRELFDCIGYFDSVRTSADDEFLRRIKTAFGPGSHRNVADALYVARVREESLTNHPDNPKFSAETGGLSPARKHYIDSVDVWHGSVHAEGRIPYLPFPLYRRPFPIDEKLALLPGGQHVRLTRTAILLVHGDCTVDRFRTLLSSTFDDVLVVGSHIQGEIESLPNVRVVRSSDDLESALSQCLVQQGIVSILDARVNYEQRFFEYSALMLELGGGGICVGLEGEDSAEDISRAESLLLGTITFSTNLLDLSADKFRMQLSKLSCAPFASVALLGKLCALPIAVVESRGVSSITSSALAVEAPDQVVRGGIHSPLSVLFDSASETESPISGFGSAHPHQTVELNEAALIHDFPLTSVAPGKSKMRVPIQVLMRRLWRGSLALINAAMSEFNRLEKFLLFAGVLVSLLAFYLGFRLVGAAVGLSLFLLCNYFCFVMILILRRIRVGFVRESIKRPSVRMTLRAMMGTKGVADVPESS